VVIATWEVDHVTLLDRFDTSVALASYPVEHDGFLTHSSAVVAGYLGLKDSWISRAISA
jgi:hypothetical protein